MRKYLISVFLLLAMITVIGVSCQSAPKPEPVPEPSPSPATPAPPPAAAPIQVSPSVIKRAEDARQRAIDFECPAYFPSEWEIAETRYDAVKSQPANQLSETVYNTSADEYDALFKKTIPLYAQAREDEIIAVRDDLIATGLRPEFPEYLMNADEIALTALDQYEAGDYYAANDTAAKALDEYITLFTGARAYLVWREITDRGFDIYDSENFDKANEYGIAALDEYEAGNNKTAAENAEEAMYRYNVVLGTGWLNYAADQWAFATNERELAILQKVNIASRDIFREAEIAYENANNALDEERYEDAALLFTDADALYVIGIRETEEKRRRAQEMISLAEDMIIESDEAAAEAEKLIGGSLR